VGRREGHDPDNRSPERLGVVRGDVFESAIVAVDVDGKGTEEIMRVFTCGNTKQGTVTQHDKGEKIGDKCSHLQSQGSPSSTFKEILTNDYPDYKYT
jgi:hypothetical protein